MTFLPYGRQSIDEADIAAVVAVLKSDWLTQGPVLEQFERKVADYCGVKHAVAVSNGTAALHLAAAALHLEPGEELWTSPNTFVASANCGRYCGADVDFVDIDSRTYNMSVAALEQKLAAARKLPKVVVPVHFAGQSCEMNDIVRLKAKYGFSIIEDAAHAVGARYLRKPVGCCEFSDLATFSFHPVKIVTTAEGGMIVTNRADLYERLILLRNHGITRDPRLLQPKPYGPWYYEQIDLGWNYRLTDVHAALGLSQMDKLDHFVNRRRQLALRYNELLAAFPVVLPWQHPETDSSWHLYVICLRESKNRRSVTMKMRELGIGVQIHYIPVHTQPYYCKLGFTPGQFPESERYYERTISLPIFPAMTDADQDRVVAALREALG